MKFDLKIDLSQIISAMILAAAAVWVASIIAPSLAPARYAPIGMGEVGTPQGFYLDTQTGQVNFGPAFEARK
jgi:hypothetical protein